MSDLGIRGRMVLAFGGSFIAVAGDADAGDAKRRFGSPSSRIQASDVAPWSTQDVIKEDPDRLSELRGELRRRLGETRYELWFGDKTQLALRDDALRVVASSAAEKQWLRRNFEEHLRAASREALGARVPVEYVVAEQPRCAGHRHTSGAPLKSIDRNATSAACAVANSHNAVMTSNPPARPRRSRTSAKPARHSLETFIPGDVNELAFRSAQEIVRRPGRYSPLLLSGPTGCGKTHLLSGIAHAVRQAPVYRSVLSLTAEQFTCQFLEALDTRTLPSFRQKCRTADVLLIDDVAFLAGKKATLEELLNTIDSLQQRDGQVVLASERSLSELAVINAELHSRISGGLSVDVQPPDYAARLTIVRQVAERLNVKIETGVDEMIARQAVGSARLISGAINRLVATSMALNQPISVELAGDVLADFARQNVPQVRLADIQRAVCDVFGVEASSLKSSRRTRRTSEPRMLAMWLARRYTRAALSEIGDFFGGRSHSTVASAQRKFERLISEKAELNVHDRPCTVEDAVRRVESALRTA